jgi:hypothetical protein
MKRLVLALVLIPAVLVSVSRADIATPFPTPHSAHNLPGPTHAKLTPSGRPTRSSRSAPAGVASPGLINSGVAMTAVTATSLISIIVLRKRHYEL